MNFSASLRIFGVKSIRSAVFTPCRSYAGGLVGKGCVGQVLSPLTLDCGTGRSSMGQIGFPVTLSNTKQNPCLVTCATAFIFWPFTLMSHKFGRSEERR